MSAEIKANVDNVMLEKQAWHGLGTVVGSQFSWADAVADNQPITFGVEKVPLGDIVFGVAENGEPIQAQEGQYVSLRSDGLILGSGLGEQATIFHASEAYRFGEALRGHAESHGLDAGLVSLGTLYGGPVWFMTFALGTFEVVGYTIKAHLTLAGSYNSSRVFTATDDDTVVVCANTLRMHDKGKRLYRFKHTSGIFDRVEEAKRALAIQRANQAVTRAQIEGLARTPVGAKAFSDMLTTLFPIDDDTHARTVNVNETARELVTATWKGSDLLTGASVTDGERNGWAFVQAVNTYENWGIPVRTTKGRTQRETLLYRQAEVVMSGATQPLTDRAAELVQSLS